MKFIPLCVLMTIVGLQSLSSKAYTAEEVSSIYSDSKTVQLSDFQSITVSQGIEVTLVKGNSNTAVIQSNYLDKVETVVEGGTLHIRYVKQRNYMNGLRNPKTQIQLTVKEMPNSYKVSSSGKLSVNDAVMSSDLKVSVSSSGDLNFKEIIQSQEADIKVSSSGSLYIPLKANHLDLDASSSGDVNGTFNVSMMNVDISSSADVQLGGNVVNLNVKSSSSADLDASKLKVVEANIVSSSSADVRLGNVSKKLNIEASSGADVNYHAASDALQVLKKTSSGASVSAY